jgi:hypothetical protein
MFLRGEFVNATPIAFPWDCSENLWEINSQTDPAGACCSRGLIHNTILLTPGVWLGEVYWDRSAQLRSRVWKLVNS